MDSIVKSGTPVVSVIVPIYRVESYLDACIDSIRRQTLADIEIILVDDGSPDNCPAMCDAYAREDTRVRVIHQANSGLGPARNSGLDIASGRWVCFVDSDDCIALNTLEACVDIGERTGVSHVRFLAQTFSYDTTPEMRNVRVSDSCVVSENFAERIAPLVDVINNERKYVNTPLESTGSACGGIYLREAIEGMNLRFHPKGGIVSEDHLFNVEFIARCRSVAYTTNRFYYYRQTPNSLSKFRKDRIDRSVEYCGYLEPLLEKFGYPEPSYIITCVMLGLLRTHFRHIFSSDMPSREKRRYHAEAASHPYLTEIVRRGDYKRMRLLPRISFIFRHSYLISNLLIMSRDWIRNTVGSK